MDIVFARSRSIVDVISSGGIDDVGRFVVAGGLSIFTGTSSVNRARLHFPLPSFDVVPFIR